MDDLSGLRAARKVRQGVVVSNAMERTVVVRVETQARHRLYKKVIKKAAKFMADDQDNRCSVGDVVRIMETRPLSKLKRWRVVEVVRKAR